MRQGKLRTILGFAVAWGLPVQAEIWLTAESFDTVASGRVQSYKEFLGFQVELGFADLSNEFITVSDDMVGQSHLQITRENYLSADAALRDKMQSKLMTRIGVITAFRPLVNHQKSSFWDEPFLRTSLFVNGNRTVPVEFLLSDFARKWANKNSGQEGPNCFYSAIASINEGWETPRYMSESEFICNLEQSFDEIGELEKFGDTLVLFSKDGIPEHAATYVGRSQKGKKILFTKNGKTEGFYLFLELDTLLLERTLYKDSLARVFRQHTPIPAWIIGCSLGPG